MCTNSGDRRDYGCSEPSLCFYSAALEQSSGWTFRLEGKSLVLLNLTFLFSQNLILEGREDLSDVLVKQGN